MNYKRRQKTEAEIRQEQKIKLEAQRFAKIELKLLDPEI